MVSKPVPPLPPSIRVGPFDWTIEVWPSALACAANHYGECDSVNQIIRLRMDVPSAHVAETFLHEMLHAMWFTGRCADGEEEKIVGIMSMQWLQVFRDNPWLPTWIAGCLA